MGRSFVYEKDQNNTTALIHAIRLGDIESVKAIIAFCTEGSEEVHHIDDESQKKVHLLDKQDGGRKATPLHEAIYLLYQDNLDASGFAKNQAESIISTIIDARPQTLYQVDGSGDPPYSFARTGGVKAHIGNLIKREIFAKLDNVIYARKALYGKQGKAIISCIVQYS